MRVGGFETFSLEWWAAVASVLSAFSSVVLIVVTAWYVSLTRRLVRAQVSVRLAAEVDLEDVGVDELEMAQDVRLSNTGSAVVIRSVEYDATGRYTGERVGGGMVAPLTVSQRPFPSLLHSGETLFFHFDEGWGLDPDQTLVVVRVTFSLPGERRTNTYVCVARIRQAPKRDE